jgi:hypothetical protein
MPGLRRPWSAPPSNHSMVVLLYTGTPQPLSWRSHLLQSPKTADSSLSLRPLVDRDLNLVQIHQGPLNVLLVQLGVPELDLLENPRQDDLGAELGVFSQIPGDEDATLRVDGTLSGLADHQPLKCLDVGLEAWLRQQARLDVIPGVARIELEMILVGRQDRCALAASLDFHSKPRRDTQAALAINRVLMPSAKHRLGPAPSMFFALSFALSINGLAWLLIPSGPTLSHLIPLATLIRHFQQ